MGAGPAGIVAAMFLARQGFKVRVLERRGDPSALQAEEANKRTFIMARMPRGIQPLRDVSSTACCHCHFSLPTKVPQNRLPACNRN